MKAIISGQVEVAVLIDNDKNYLITLDNPELKREVSNYAISRIFADANDVISIDVASEKQVKETLELLYMKDRALLLILILLDVDEVFDNRMLAAECLSEFLLSKNSEDVIAFLENRLYSAPLPPNADIDKAIEFSKKVKGDKLASLLITLRDSQEEIKKRCEVDNQNTEE